jgi:hypothetical protein
VNTIDQGSEDRRLVTRPRPDLENMVVRLQIQRVMYAMMNASEIVWPWPIGSGAGP